MIQTKKSRHAPAGDSGLSEDFRQPNSTTNGPPPKPDKTAIATALEVLFDPGDIVELRAIYKARKRTDAGYFNSAHHNDLAQHAENLNRLAAVYVTLNPVDPALLSRYANRVEKFAKNTAQDRDVVRRRWFLIDLDPVRPADTSATDEQLKAAKAKAKAIRDYLQRLGWPAPLVTESGNGYHLLYPVDLPNDDTSREAFKSALIGLAESFDDDKVKVDRTVFNAGRIVKLYGTVANKGDHTPLAPWRLSRIVANPGRPVTVTLDQLQSLAPPAQEQAKRQPPHHGTRAPFDLDSFLTRLNIEYSQDQHGGRERFRLAHCPFNPDHGKAEAAIFRDPSGALGFKCMHSGCADKNWQDVRAIIDGPRESRNTNSSSHTGGKGEEWPEPQPLPDGLPPVAEFDYDLLPDTLQPWARDICERVQCAPDYVGVTIMVGLGSVIGRKIGIRPQSKTDWTVTPNQWGKVIGRPGVLKSPAMEAALSPLKRLAALATKAHEPKVADYKARAALFKLQQAAAAEEVKKKLSKGGATETELLHCLQLDEPELPALRRYLTNDSTAAALGELHRQNQNGLLVFRDEIVSLLKSFDREDNSEARGFYLTGWNGDSPYTFDRIMRGMNLHIPAVCLSMLGSTQPGKIAEYIRHAVQGGIGDDGLIQRFGLMVWPDNGGDWKDVDRWPDNEAKLEANRVFEYLDQLDPATVGAETPYDSFGSAEGMPFLRFDGQGHGLFLEWRTGLEARLRSGNLHPAMESHLAQFRKLVPGLALICHLADGGTGPVSERPILKALAWSEYLETHAQRVYASVVMPEVSAAKAIIQRIKKGDLPKDGFSSRDVWRPGWVMLSDRQQVADALRLLVDLDWLGAQKHETQGRTATVFSANPRGFQ